MNEHLSSNQNMWDSFAEAHVESQFYDVDSFRKGRCTLSSIELEQLGDVTGKDLLHLQCHFGMDTLSWSRLGAKAVGVDFSPKAIGIARSLAVECEIPAEFICSDIGHLPTKLNDRFDIVFTSAGVLCWLPELTSWADAIARCLRPGGLFYIREFHPFAGMLDDAETATKPICHYPYFHSKNPDAYTADGSYASSTPGKHTSYEWAHSMSDILTALLSAGLTLMQLDEFPCCSYQAKPYLTRGKDGMWRNENGPDLPLMFSLSARK